MIDNFLTLWLTDIQKSRKNKTFYSPARDFGGQYHI